MAQVYEYALMSASAYWQNRDARNRVTPSADWQPLSLSAYPDGHAYDAGSSFEAVAYRKNNEIVIAFTGTDETQDWWTNLGAGSGIWLPDQAKKAAEFYAMVTRQYGGEGVSISFAGHSLGGGLAGLMGVMFNKVAWAFDPAPFRQSANNDTRDQLLVYLQDCGYTETSIIGGLSDFHSSLAATRPSDEPGIRGENQVFSMIVRNEALNKWIGYPNLFVGFPVRPPVILPHGAPSQSAIDLHDISLLTAMKLDERFELATLALSNLIPVIYDENLFDKDRSADKPVLLDHLLRYQTINASTYSGLLNHFTNDLAKIATASGDAVSQNDLNRALIAFVGRGYLKQSNGFEREILNAVSGGLKIDVAAVSSDIATDKGYIRYFAAFLQERLGSELYAQFHSVIEQAQDWYLASTELNATAGDKTAFMLGAANTDRLTGGSGNDLLAGLGGADILDSGAGADILIGGQGNDVLYGGAGADTSIVKEGEGSDSIVDCYGDGRGGDGQGTILYVRADGSSKELGGTLAASGSGNKGECSDGEFTYRFTGALNADGSPNGAGDLLITRNGGDERITIRNYKNGDLGLTLTPAPISRLAIDGTPGSDHLSGPADQSKTIHAGAGNDRAVNGTGDDQLYGEEGNDILIATSGADELFGGVGNDALQGGADSDVLDGGAGNDLLDGGAGQDVLQGGDGADYLFGGGSLVPTVTDQQLTDPNGPAWGVTDINGQPGLANVGGLSDIDGDGADLIDGGAGNDFIDAGGGDDYAMGGAGSDILVGLAGSDILQGGDDDDRLHGDGSQGDVSTGDGQQLYAAPAAHGNDILDGGDGNDALYGDGAADDLIGGTGNDTLHGDAPNLDAQYHGNDRLDGGDGADTLYGEGGNDQLLGGAGDDFLEGDALSVPAVLQGDDNLDGGDGNDTLQGDGGDDTLAGGAGDDRLFGDADDVPAQNQGADILDGGDGNDSLRGMGDDDQLAGGSGDDMLQGDAGNDLLAGGDGIDILDGGDGDDQLTGDGGNDELHGGAGSDILAGGDGADQLSGDAGDDQMVGGDGNDILDGGDGANTLMGDAGNDQLQGGQDNDILTGGADNDILIGQAGSDTLDGGDGVDNLDGGAGDDQLTGGDGIDNLLGAEGNDSLDGGAGADVLVGEDGDDILQGGAGDDLLAGDNGLNQNLGGDDHLDGGEGNDTLIGDGGNDSLAGGAGADMLSGGEGNDTYIYNLGDGIDHIADSNANGQINTLVFGAGIDPAQIRLGLGSLLLDLGNGDAVHIDNFDPNDPTGSCSIQRFQFADGSTFNIEQLLERGFEFTGTNGNDTLTGTGANDHLAGGPGDDLLKGGLGDDTYLHNRGDGADRIEDYEIWTKPTGEQFGDMNVLSLGAGIAPSDIVVRMDPATRNVVLDLGGGDSVDIGLIGNLGVQVLKFAGGSSQYIREFFANTTFDITGTPADEQLTGTPYNDRIDGKAGNDSLTGGAGSDIFVYNLGAGADIIQDGGRYFGFPGADGNTLKLGAGITPEMIRVRHVGSRCVLDLGNGDSVDIGNMSFSDEVLHGFDLNANPFTSFAIQTVEFADGTTRGIQDFVDAQGLAKKGGDGAQTLVGDDLYHASIPDRLEGGKGADTLRGGAGSDIYVFNRGDGADTIDDSQYGMVLDTKWNEWMPNGPNTLRFGAGIVASDIVPRWDATSNRLTLDLGNGDSVDIGSQYNLAVQAVEFADGTRYDIEDLLNTRAVVVAGTPGADFISGSRFVSILQGLGSSDTLVGGDSTDTLDGGPGDDSLAGLKGNDIYRYYLGDGNDTVRDHAWLHGTDENGQPVWIEQPNSIAFGPGISERTITPLLNDGNLLLRLPNGEGMNVGSLTDIAIQTLQFDDGSSVAMDDFLSRKGMLQRTATPGNDVMATLGKTSLLQGLDGDDQLNGSVRDETLEGGAGNDRLIGDAGSDIYLYNMGDGADTIIDSGELEGGDENILRFGAGITPESINPLYNAVAQSLTLDLGNGDQLALGRLNNLAVQVLRFADGTELTVAELVARRGGFVQIGTSGDDWLDGTQLADRIEGFAGNDTLNGRAGDDIFIGGPGNDDLDGAEGGDTYIYNRGDGIDTIHDNAGGGYWGAHEEWIEAENVLVFGEDITPEMVRYVTSPEGSVAIDLGNGDRVNIGPRDELVIQRIKFADGSSISPEDVLTRQPQANPVADQLTRQGDAFAFTLPVNAFVDPNGDVLTYSARQADGRPLPAWLSFNAASRTFSGTPGNDDVATLSLKITATDPGGLTAASNFALEVQNVNDAPTVVNELNDQEVRYGQTFNFVLPLDTFADVDSIHGDRLQLSASLADGSPLPAWLNFDAVEGVFTGTPDEDATGVLNVKVTVTDSGGLEASTRFDLNLGGVNRAPTVVEPIADQVTRQGDTFSFAVPGNTFADPDGDNLTFTATLDNGDVLPAWLCFDGTTGTFSGVPGNDDVASLDLMVTATDPAGLSASRVFTLDVLNVNDAPTVVQGLDDQSATEGHAFSYKLPSGGGGGHGGFLSDPADTGTPYGTGYAPDQLYVGEEANDTYDFARGDGLTMIQEWDETSGHVDTVNFGSDIAPEDVAVGTDRLGNAIFAVKGTSDRLIVEEWFNDDAAKIERLVFADGTVWNPDDVESRISVRPTAENDRIAGTDGNDQINALAGEDALFGGEGDDLLAGGAGHDLLDGEGGADILDGGSGDEWLIADRAYADTQNDLLAGGAGVDVLSASISNDVLMGGAGDDEVYGEDGNDVLLFNRGDGSDDFHVDYSENEAPLAQRTDTVSLGGGIAYADLMFERDDDNLIMHVGNDESITFTNWFIADYMDCKAVNRLQIVAEAMPGYDARSSDPLFNKRVQAFDFLGLANRFEAVLEADPGIVT